MNCVLDACAMVAYLEGEPGDAVVDALLSDNATTCFAHSINLCEVFYQVLRTSDLQTARDAITTLRADGVIERKDMSEKLWQDVGVLKARGRISISDCFCVCLAQQLSAEVVTSDHKEFDPLVSVGLVPIRFIR